MTRLTQKQQVLLALRAAGARGITQADMLGPGALFGRNVLRLASRIDELKKDGYVIVPAGKRDKCKVYSLAGDRRVDRVPLSSTETNGTAALFEPAIATPTPRSPYDVGGDS